MVSLVFDDFVDPRVYLFYGYRGIHVDCGRRTIDTIDAVAFRSIRYNTPFEADYRVHRPITQ